MLKRAVRSAIITFLFLRLGTSLFMFAASQSIEPNHPPAHFLPGTVRALERLGPFSRSLLLPWYRWDTTHYLQIAEQGYAANLENTVWPPLYPALIRLFSYLIHPALMAALTISSLALLAGLTLLYVTVAETWDESTARRTLFWLAVFPSAFFLSAAYTESLFLALSLACLYASSRKRWLLASLFAALASLTRMQGIFLAGVILLDILNTYRLPIYKRLFKPATAIPLAGLAAPILPDTSAAAVSDRAASPGWWKAALPAAVLTGLAPLSFGAYAAYVHFRLGTEWPWQTLAAGWHQHMDWPWSGILGDLAKISRLPISFDISAMFYDVILGIWALVMVWKGWKLLPTRLLFFTLAMLVTALMKVNDNGTTASVLRYILPIFPLFIVQALTLKERTAQALWATFCLLSQGYLLYLFYRWMWVA